MTAQVLAVRSSVWGPLNRPAFRALFIGACIAWVGGFMQDVAAAWLMTSLAPSPIMVSLLQTASNLPFFLLALPAGALSDLIDKRYVMFVSQVWILLAVIALGGLTLAGAMTPWLLLTLIFFIGIGCVINAPAFNSLAPDLVAPGEIGAAVALVAAGFNMMRGIGSAVGGFLVGGIGAGNVFLLNAASMAIMLFVLARLKHRELSRTAPPENVIGAMKAGMRYLKHSMPLRAVLMRTALFAFFSSCLWALLPLLAREDFKLNAALYGILISIFGLGNVVGAALVPRLRQQLSQDVIATMGTLFVACCMGMLACVHEFPLASVAMFGGGVGWITTCAALNTSLLSASPLWVRARVLSIYLLVFQGCLAGGALLWGFLANAYSMQIALQVGGAGLVLTLASMLVYPLRAAEHADMSASPALPPPELPIQPHPDHGPVVISIEYRIDPERLHEFNVAIAALEVKRRRDGACQWHLYSDLERPGHYIEMFQVETWGEYLRQLERTTVQDRFVEERVYSLHLPTIPPVVTLLISERRRSRVPKTKELVKPKHMPR